MNADESFLTIGFTADETERSALMVEKRAREVVKIED